MRNITWVIPFVLLAFSASCEDQFIIDDPKTEDPKYSIINLAPSREQSNKIEMGIFGLLHVRVLFGTTGNHL
jgi:hypothetical protein